MKRKCAVVFVVGLLLLMASACGSQKGSKVQNRESRESMSQSQGEMNTESINQSQNEVDTEGISQSQDGANNVTKTEEITKNNTEESNQKDRINEQKTGGRQMIIEVNGQQFNAELYDNDTAAALRNRLPMTVDMEEMNGNEKYYFMDESLPSAAENIGTIQNGDIMLYGSDCLVLFFKTFDTSYTYTRIGHIEDAEGFSEALERGTVEISFYIE